MLRACRDDYHGFHTRPFDWSTARDKFDRVTRAFTEPVERDAIAEIIATLEQRPVAALTSLIGAIRSRTTQARPGSRGG